MMADDTIFLRSVKLCLQALAGEGRSHAEAGPGMWDTAPTFESLCKALLGFTFREAVSYPKNRRLLWKRC